MKVLIIGSGGREHALAWAISKSPLLRKLYAAPGSDAIAELAERASPVAEDRAAVARYCREKEIALAVIGPETPLAAGLADALREAGISVFGPGAGAARLEASKSFAKAFLNKHKIPTANYSVQTDLTQARRAAMSFGFPVVVKADGLAAGKGVRVCENRDELNATLKAFLIDGALGGAGKRVVVEELLKGPEASILGFCDGRTFLELPPSQDHKRLKNGDEGPNTGGMGVIAPSPCVDAAISSRIRAEIIDPVLAGLREDGIEYRGALYIGVMLTKDGPKVLEFNVRFGDPETQALVPLIEDDVLERIAQTAAGRLPDEPLTVRGSAACVVLASEGYPASPVTGREISGLDTESENVLIFHAGTRREDGVWKTAGGRVLGVTGLGESPAAARAKAYEAAARIRFDGMLFRKDIGISAESTASAGSKA